MQTRVIIVLLALAVGAVGVARADRFEQIPLRSTFATFPMSVAAWTGVLQPPLSAREIEVLGADDHLVRAYFDESRKGVGLYIGYYGTERGGRPEHTPEVCYPMAGFSIVESRTVSIDRARGLRANEFLVERSGLPTRITVPPGAL